MSRQRVSVAVTLVCVCWCAPDANGQDPRNQRAEQAAGDKPQESPPLDLTSLEYETGRTSRIVSRYRSDRSNLRRFYSAANSPKARSRMMRFYADWLSAVADLDRGQLSELELAEIEDLERDLADQFVTLEQQLRYDEALEPLLPFASTIYRFIDEKLAVVPMRAEQAARRTDALPARIDEARTWVTSQLETAAGPSQPAPSRATLERAAERTGELRRQLERWHAFYAGYDPLFTWWMRAPYATAAESLESYQAFLTEQAESLEAPEAADPAEAVDPAAIVAGLRASGAPSGDVPDLQALLDEPRGYMELVVRRYQLETRGRRGRGGRGAGGRRERELARSGRDGNRDTQQEPPTRAKTEPEETREETARPDPRERAGQWLAALQALDFDSFSRDDQLDYLLLRADLDRQLTSPPAAPNRGRGRRPELEPLDDSQIPGRPVGREALLRDLARDMIDYTPEELIEIGHREMEWCRAELIRASREMGLGDDWKAAIEKVKTMHVPPGEQPQLIRMLAWEAIDYLRDNDLISVPNIAAETWGMQMMSPQRQLVNPFFTGGSSITVSFPTDTMTHEAKLQSMRGNNIPFARATVHHELIPGHNLQGFMNARYSTHRRSYNSPFWREGWALYWELVLYDRGFPATPEDRIGFLVWRSHRCARIVFSLSFHMGRMLPGECVDYLVDNVGFDRKNAEGEVRRSFGGSYAPLYQAAYLLGGLQLRQLRRELVESGKMPEREFHDRVIRAGAMPIKMVRLLLNDEPLERDHIPDWRFYDD